MSISSRLGFPDLFITFTCNPTWPEIMRALSQTRLQPHDLPDIITKVFKIKFDELMDDITKQHVMGKVLACKYYSSYYIKIFKCLFIATTLHVN